MKEEKDLGRKGDGRKRSQPAKGSDQTNMKRPNPQATADNWNKAHPVGTPVTRYKLINPLREPQETKTRSEAWVMGGHSAMVMVDGVSGGVMVESVVPRSVPDGNDNV